MCKKKEPEYEYHLCEYHREHTTTDNTSNCPKCCWVEKD